MWTHEKIPILVLLENQRNGRLDRRLERADIAARAAGANGRSDAIDRPLQFRHEAFGGCIQSIGFRLSECAVERRAERREKRRHQRQPHRVNQQVEQRAHGRQREQRAVHTVHPMQQGVLFDRDMVMIVALLLQNIHGPSGVARDERRIGPCGGQQLPCQRFGERAQRRNIVGTAQVLARIEYPEVPIRFFSRFVEIEQWGHHRQIPGQFRGRARAQPLTLPVLPVALPVNGADGADHDDFGYCLYTGVGMQHVVGAVPSERQGQHGTQYRDSAQ